MVPGAEFKKSLKICYCAFTASFTGPGICVTFNNNVPRALKWELTKAAERIGLHLHVLVLLFCALAVMYLPTLLITASGKLFGFVINTAAVEPKPIKKFCKLFPSIKKSENAKYFTLISPWNNSLKCIFFFLFKPKINGWFIWGSKARNPFT